MLMCIVSVLVYVLICDIDLAIGSADSEYFWDGNPKNSYRKLAPVAKTKNEAKHNSHIRHEREPHPKHRRATIDEVAERVTDKAAKMRRRDKATREATKIDNSKFRQRPGKSIATGFTDSLNITRIWPLLRARFTKKNRNNKGTTRMSPMKLVQTKSKRTKDAEKEKSILITPYNLVAEMYELCEEIPNANITIEKLSRTIEYNDIILMKITQTKNDTDNVYFRTDKDKYLDETPPKKIVFIVHALTTMGLEHIPCLKEKYYFKELISYYLAHLDKFDIFLMPMANPDGSKLTTWNKNVAPQSACIGVALDRNFDVAWNVSKKVSSCSQQYPGPLPFSEPETRAVRSVFQRYSHKIVAYFHVHGGTFDLSTFKGDAVLYPRGYTDAITDDDKYVDLRADIDEMMKNASFRVVSVTVDTLYNWYGQVAGTSVDYASTIYGIPYALELVMQPYRAISGYALKEIWKRVIDVVFNSIWKSLRTNEVL